MLYGACLFCLSQFRCCSAFNISYDIVWASGGELYVDNYEVSRLLADRSRSYW